MADPLTLLCCLGKFGEIVLGGIGDCLVGPIKRQFTYMCCFHSNIMELETQLKDLETTRQGVQMGVEESRRSVRVIGPNVDAWLTRANEVTTEVEGIIQDKDKVKEGCLNGWCPNLKLRYSLSRKAVKKIKVVVDLNADGVPYTQSSYSQPPPCLETITIRDFMGFESRRIIMEEIIKALKHDEINLIGVCGMGGVGKTKMVQEVGKRVKEEKLFDEVAFVAVGQNPDITKVQNSIAENFGLDDLKTKDDATTRASMLRRRLSQDNKKILLILDDIWAEFDLEDQGIPLGGSHETFKIIYTSRTLRFQGIWHDVPNKKDIPLELLSKDEAWQLFREKAGDSADAPDLQPIAKQIVDKCGCLPLALVLIGSALSKKSGRNYMKEIWKGTLDRLNCAGSTPADKDLSSRLALSYEYLEDEQAKRLFLLCCLFGEDEDIYIEDLARYGLGLSLIDGIPEIEKVRRQVFLIVDDLKSRYLLLDGKNKEECVQVHDAVRDMGLYVASKFALVIHGEESEWPKKDTYEDYTSISLVSRKITKLPKRLTCPNLEFLLLDCTELKELSCQFFEGMGKLKVLVLKNFKGILALPSSLRNLHTLSLPFFNGKLDNVSEFGELINLKTLSFRDSRMKELPEEIGELVNLRLLDLTGYYGLLKRIPPNVISRLVNLEELCVGGVVDLRKGRKVDFKKLYGRGKFKDWEGEGKEEEGRNANLRELKFLSNLNTLEIFIRSDVLIPKVRIFSKLKIYKVIIVQDVDRREVDKKGSESMSISEQDVWDKELEDELYNLFSKCKRVFMVGSSTPVPSNRGGIDSLLRRSDWLYLKGKGCNDLVQALLLRVRDGVDGLQQLKLLRIERCDTPECLANTRNPVHLPIAIFPILEVLDLLGLENLREICGGPVPARSFGELTFIQVQNCGRLRNLFQLTIVGCLPQLKRLIISSCGMMEEVFWKDQQEDVHAAANRIEFPKLEVLKLEKLPSLMRFCRGIDQIDFPQLKELYLEDIPQVNILFHNSCNLSFNSTSSSLFPEKVSLPNLEVLHICKLANLVFPNVNVNTTTLAKSTDHYHNPMQPQPLFNKKVPFPCLKYLGLSGLQNVSDLWGSELPTSSFSKLKNLQVTDPVSLRNKVCIVWINDLNNTTQGLQEVAGLLYYTRYDDNGVLALGSNGTMTMWKWARSQLSPREKVTTNVLPSYGRAMTNDVTGVNLEEAVPCMAVSNIYAEIISACGGAISLFNTRMEVKKRFMPPPPASTFLAFYPQEYNIIAIGMEDSTIRIYNHSEDEVKSELKGHEKRITGLAFSTNLNILVSSAADAQLCIWRIDTWEHLKSVSIPLPADKACNGDTRVQFHSDRIRLLVSHETQLAIYDASEMDRIRQWVPQDILPAHISFAVYSCDSQLVYTSFHDGNIGVFDADSLTLACRIVPSIYLYPAMLSGGQAVYPRVIAAHPRKPNQFAIGLTNGSVVLMEPQESEGKWGLSPSIDNEMLNDRTTSSSHTSYHTPDQNGDGPMARSMEKPKTLDDVTDKSKPWKVAETQCQLVVMPDSTDEAHKVARLLYRNGCEVLALGCNGALRRWRRYASKNNQSGKATVSVFPLQWQPAASGLANDVTGVNLEEAVPCMAFSKSADHIYSACGGAISVFDPIRLRVMTKFIMSPPPSSTFLAVHPQDNNIIAVGMEDSTIRIYNRWLDKVESEELKGHEKRITGLAFSTNLNILVSSGVDAQLSIWRIDTWEHLKSVPIQLPAGKACNGDTRVQFHSDQIHLLVSHETQLAIYDASKMDRIRQWVPQDVLPAPISFAAYSCDGQIVYTSFCDGNIGVFDADSLTLICHILPSVYFPTLSSGSQAVYPTVVATHPWKPNQFAIGLTNGSVILIEPPESEGKWGLSPTVYHKGMLNDRIASSSNTSNHKPDQEEEVDVDEYEEDQEEKRKKKEKVICCFQKRKKKEKGKAPQFG